MLRSSLLLIGFLFLTLGLNAQTTSECCKNDGKPYDYCYSNDKLPNRCVGFRDGDTLLHITTNGKLTSYPLPKQNNATSLLKLYYMSKKKLAPEDLFVIQMALPKWDSVKMRLGYTFTSTGLGYKIATKGTGKLPEAGKKVSVHYRGTLSDGTEFDNSFKRGQPIEFPLGTGQVIRGWDEGIQLFPVGSKGILMIPANLGYGSRGAGGVIPANATLFFEIEVVSAE
jgi:hypothetical protein